MKCITSSAKRSKRPKPTQSAGTSCLPWIERSKRGYSEWPRQAQIAGPPRSVEPGTRSNHMPSTSAQIGGSPFRSNCTCLWAHVPRLSPEPKCASILKPRFWTHRPKRTYDYAVNKDSLLCSQQGLVSAAKKAAALLFILGLHLLCILLFLCSPSKEIKVVPPAFNEYQTK